MRHRVSDVRVPSKSSCTQRDLIPDSSEACLEAFRASAINEFFILHFDKLDEKYLFQVSWSTPPRSPQPD